MKQPAVWIWSLIAVGAPWIMLLTESWGDMWIVLLMFTLVGLINILRAAKNPTIKQFWPAKTQQAVSGASVGLLIGACAGLAMGVFADSDHTITIGAILLWVGATTRAGALILKSKEDELHASEPAAQPS